MRNVLDKNCREILNTYFIFNKFFPKSYSLCDNVEKFGRASRSHLTKTGDTQL
jgi:hypothetical protein